MAKAKRQPIPRGETAARTRAEQALVDARGTILKLLGAPGSKLGHGTGLKTLDRQERILSAMLSGLSARQIAERYGVSLSTIVKDQQHLQAWILEDFEQFNPALDIAMVRARIGFRRLRLEEAIGRLDDDSPRLPALESALNDLEKVEHVVLTQAGLRQPPPEGAMVDAGDYANWSLDELNREYGWRLKKLYAEALDAEGKEAAKVLKSAKPRRRKKAAKRKET